MTDVSTRSSRLQQTGLAGRIRVSFEFFPPKTDEMERSLWEADFEGAGFEWIDANDADQNVLSFVRYSADRSRSLACIANLSGIDRPGYRIGVPRQGVEVRATGEGASSGQLRCCWRSGSGSPIRSRGAPGPASRSRCTRSWSSSSPS